jgi:cytidyltransferase-like protein
VNTSGKVRTLDAARAWRQSQHVPVVFTNGVFDLLHPGHLALLEAARAEGGWLILAGHDAGPEGARQTTALDTLEHLCGVGKDPENGIWLDTVERITEYVRDARA